VHLRTPRILKGHSVLSYFSSVTGKPFPLFFHRGEEALEINARSTVAVN
jgi:LysR family transcriptional regulator, regulator for bpeEF and oprC